MSTVIVVMAIVSFASPVVAEGDPDALFDELSEEQEQQVIVLIDEGQQAYDDGEFDEARDDFEEVYELFPHPDVIYRIAQCYERLGDDELAIQRYRQFLEEVPDAPERGRVERTIETLEQELGDDLSTVRVQTAPSEAFVYVDDPDTVPAGQTPVDVTLEPGTYRLYIEKPGHESLEEEVDVERGETVRIRVDLSEVEAEAEESRPAVKRRQPQKSTSWWEPTISVALFGLGGWGVYQAAGYHSEYERLAQAREDMSGEEGSSAERQRRADVERDRDQALMMRNAVGIAGGAALLGGALYTTWWIARGPKNSGAVIGLAPRVGGGIQFGVRGTF